MVFHWTCACQQQLLSKDHCNEIIYVIIMWLFILKSFSKDFSPAVLLIPHSHSVPLTLVILYLITFSSQRVLWEGTYVWMGNLLITLLGFLKDREPKRWKASLFVIVNSMQRTFLNCSVNLWKIVPVSVEEIITGYKRKNSEWLLRWKAHRWKHSTVPILLEYGFRLVVYILCIPLKEKRDPQTYSKVYRIVCSPFMSLSPSFNNYNSLSSSFICTSGHFPYSWIILKQIPDIMSCHLWYFNMYF